MYKVVIIDDDPIIRKGLCQTIDWENYGFQAAGEAGDGKAGSSLIERVKPDLIITDIRMPGMTGFDMLDQVAGLGLECEIIIITAFRHFEYARAALNHGARDILLKPARIEEIINAVVRAGEALKARDARHDEELRLKELFVKHLPALREKFLHSLVFGREIWREGIQDRMKLFRIEWQGFRALIIRFHFSSLPNIRTYEQHLQQLGVVSILEKTFSGILDVVNIGIQEGHLVLLLGFQPEHPVDMKIIRDVCEQTLVTVKSNFSLPLTMSLSAYHENFTALRAAYEEAAVTLERSFYTGPEVVLEFDGTRMQGPAKGASCSLNRDDLLFAVRAGNIRQVEAWLQDPGPGCRDSTDAAVVKGQFLDILIQLQELARTAGMDSGNEDDRLTLFTRLYECRTLQELKILIADLALKIAGCILEHQQLGIERVVDSAKKIINDKYASVLNLQDVADQVYVSASYLSRIFKRVTDMNFIEYVNMVRVDAAKKWLLETDLMAYQIAERVGFQDPHYFSRIFKKVTGLGPREFREQNAETV